MARINHKVTDRADGDLNLVAPLEYVEFDEPLDKFTIVGTVNGLFGEPYNIYRDESGEEFGLGVSDCEIIASMWARSNGPLRIYIRRENRLGQIDNSCNTGLDIECTRCPNIIPFERFGGSRNVYYCTQCDEDKWTIKK